MTIGEVLAALKSLLPPGAQNLYDFASGDVGQIFEGLAEAWKTYGYDPTTDLAANINPATCDVDALGTWEVVLGLTLTRIAQYGSTDLRRSAVLSKLREAGPTSIPNVKSIIGPLLGYANPTQLVVIEADRAALRAAHTYAFAGGALPAPGTLSDAIHILDAGKISAGGIHLVVDVTHAAVEDLSFTVTSPDGDTISFALSDYGYSGSVTNLALTLRSPATALNPLVSPVQGDWTLDAINAGASAGTVNSAAIFVEGIGRVGFSQQEGLGAAVFCWGVFVDATLEGVAHESDRAAARAALDRIRQAHTYASLLLDNGSGGACWIPNISLPNACIPCP